MWDYFDDHDDDFELEPWTDVLVPKARCLSRFEIEPWTGLAIPGSDPYEDGYDDDDFDIEIIRYRHRR